MIIAPRFVGLCGADVQVLRGARRAMANTLGHEGVGVVAEVGESVTGWSPGNPVVFNPVNPFNRHEILGDSFDGLFQERVLARNVESANWPVQRVPGSMLGPIGALVEPVGTAIYSQELVGGGPERHVAVVVGDGPVALINSVALRHRGFETVLLVHGRSQRYRWAVDRGYFDAADVIFGWGDVAERIIERLGGAFADVAVICTPGEAVEQALRDALIYLKPGGVIDLVSAANPSVVSLRGRDLNTRALRYRNWCGQPPAGHFEQVETTDGKRIRVAGQHGTSSDHLNASVALIDSQPDDFSALITDVVDLADAPELISSVVTRSFGSAVGDRPMKVVIELNRGEF